MSKKFVMQIVASVLLAAGGVAGFFTIIPVTTVNLAPLSRLVITDPKIPNIAPKATYSAPTSVASARLPVLDAGYLVAPGQTGAFTAQWFGLGDKGGNVGVFLELLPSAALATTAASQQVSTSMTSAALTAVKYTLQSSFTIPGVPGSLAVSYLIPSQPKKSSTGAEIPQAPIAGFTAEIREGRVAARIDLNGFAATKARLVQVATHQAAVMKSGLANLKNMASLAYPVGSSLILWGVVAVLIGLVFLIPYLAKRLELSKIAREEAQRRYQLQSRGAKIARRRGVARR
jgi:hypothetical protein